MIRIVKIVIISLCLLGGIATRSCTTYYCCIERWNGAGAAK